MTPGERVPPVAWEVTREQITAYAKASGDANPIHLDEEFAKSVGLPGVIAHGMLGMAQLANTVVAFAGDHHRLRGLRCRFAGMMLPGDIITFAGSVTKVENGVVTLELSAANQRGERILTKAAAELTA